MTETVKIQTVQTVPACIRLKDQGFLRVVTPILADFLACRIDDVAMRDPDEFKTLSARLQSLIDALADACERKKAFPAASSGVFSKG